MSQFRVSAKPLTQAVELQRLQEASSASGFRSFGVSASRALGQRDRNLRVFETQEFGKFQGASEMEGSGPQSLNVGNVASRLGLMIGGFGLPKRFRACGFRRSWVLSRV